MKALRLVLALCALAPLGVCGAGETARTAATNHVFRLTIESWKLQPNYGSTKAPEGRQFAVLATRWENRIDPKLAAERGLATTYLIPELAQHCFLVLDAQHLGGLRKIDDGTGRSSLAKIELAKPGAQLLGDVVFEVPAGKFTSVDLRFYDDTAGYVTLALAGATPDVKPLLPPQKNAVAEVGVFALENPARGVISPPGRRAIAVDLRARSVWKSEGEASPYDATVAPGSLVPRVNLLDWSELPKQLTVLADGDVACPPADASALPATARFIPEFFAGGRIVFSVPDDAKSLELLCEMPHASTASGVLDLPPLRFTLVGTPPPQSAAAPAGALKIQDEMFALTIGARRPATFAGETAGSGRQFVALTVAVTNGGTTGEYFQPKEQLFLLDAEGAEQSIDELTARGPRAPAEQVHLAPGETRRFEVVFRVPSSGGKTPRLSFHGGSFQQTYDLP